MRFLLCLCVLLAPAGAFGQAGELQLKISTPASVTAPMPARVVLHFHNTGRETLWLYKPTRDPSAVEWDARFGPLPSGSGASTSGGSQAAIHLQPAQAPAPGETSAPARGVTFEPARFPHPRVLRVPAGGDAQETIVVSLNPAHEKPNGKEQPLWGAYKLSVKYSARFSNGDALQRIAGVHLWQGEVTSNTVSVRLQPPAASNQGTVEGTVATADQRAIPDALVSLSDREERPVAQTTSDAGGEFAFHHLPPGFYWVTARRRAARHETDVFQHVELSAGQTGRVQLVMFTEENYKAQELFHKPVFIRVTDPAGHPLSGVRLHNVWTTGTVLEDTKTQVPDDGLAVMELIPGRNFMTLERRGCRKEDRRVDVAAGNGVDGAALVLACRK